MAITHTANPGEPPIVEQKGLIGKTDSHWSKGLALHIQGPQAWARFRADQTSP